ncbi:MAG: metallophosphoesterase [Candidatus Caldarchaeum sp.]
MLRRREAIASILLTGSAAFFITDDSPRLDKTIIDIGLGAKAVFLPDLHLHSENTQTNQLLSALNQEEPEAVVLGGDVVDELTTDLGYVKKFLSELPGSEKFFVMGNHDYWSGYHVWLRENLQHLGFSEVRGGVLSRYLGKIYGFDWSDDRVYEPLQAKGLVFAHDPHVADSVSGDCLILAGHTHGGIVFNGVVILSNSRYTRGWYTWGSRRLYVSRGLGQMLAYRPTSPRELVVLV